MREYAAIDAVNWSTLRAIIESPLAYQAALVAPREETDAMRLGSAIHCATLEPDEYPLRYAVWTGGIRRGKEWDAFQVAIDGRKGKTVLTEDQHRVACSVRDAVRGHAVAGPLLVGGEAEGVLEWTDARTGIALKGRFDYRSTALADLKTTTKGIGGREFGASVARWAYHGQMAFYRRGLVATRGADPDLPCVLIAAQSVAPYDVAAWELDADTLYRGETLVDWCLDRLVACRASGEWPGAHRDKGTLALPGWYRQPNEDDGEAGAAWLMGDL